MLITPIAIIGFSESTYLHKTRKLACRPCHTQMAAALNQSEANNSVATVSPEQPPTIINDSIDCEDSLNSSKIDPVVDVSFLTEKEKTQILKVIKVDLELRRTALE